MKHKETYDRLAAGLRLQERRKELGWSRKYVAGKIGVVERYYADIERGVCGMSVETLMGLSQLYDFSLDYLIYGTDSVESDLVDQFDKLPQQARQNGMRILSLFMESCGVQQEKAGSVSLDEK